MHGGALESDALSQMELESVLISPGGSRHAKSHPAAPLWGTITPEVAKYLAVLLVGWFSVRALEIGCGGGIAPSASQIHRYPTLYVADQADDVPVSAYIAGSDLPLGGHNLKSVMTSFAPVHFPAVPLTSLFLSHLQPISVTKILVPTLPLPSEAASRNGTPQPPVGLTVQ